MDFLSQYIVLIVVAICLCLGYIIKHSISFIPNKYIPLIMAIAGTILNVWINGWKFTPEILLGGLISGLASTGTHEMYRNLVWKKDPFDSKVKASGKFGVKKEM
ncbi:phage holin family protein [Mobilitalea sibirica]|uniref:Phage holin family protein n=1 Tax=Mobilitalea sibirica TaxID=1462919 RepID=A0A8J7KU60_9FIRM|nr:phage holin family protein [Mobilitalea sibirica]MBH1942111.1 phage holin family protein [Mobilitalea sibirica]